MVRRKAILRFWGVRGSVPTPGPTTAKVGGNTACVELRVGDECVIFDAGSGLRLLGAEVMGRKQANLSILLSHYHWDHLLGLPFFAPIFQKGARLSIYGEGKSEGGPREALEREFSSPHFPVLLKMLPCTLDFHDVHPGDTFTLGPVEITVGRLHHPQGAVGYRAKVGNKVVVYASDHEHGSDIDSSLVEFCRGANVLIYDAAYTDEIYECGKKGWGHSTWQAAARLALEAGVGRLYLFHHDPSQDDKTLFRVERALRKHFPAGYLAREGMEIEL